jgi:hypothetical protein
MTGMIAQGCALASITLLALLGAAYVAALFLQKNRVSLQLNKRQLEGGDHLVAVYGDNFLSAAHFSLSALAVSPATAPQQAALQRGDAELLQKRLALTDFQVKTLYRLACIYSYVSFFRACCCSGTAQYSCRHATVYTSETASACTYSSSCSSCSTADAPLAVTYTFGSGIPLPPMNYAACVASTAMHRCATTV